MNRGAAVQRLDQMLIVVEAVITRLPPRRRPRLGRNRLDLALAMMGYWWPSRRLFRRAS
jgi:hypothetical protein